MMNFFTASWKLLGARFGAKCRLTALYVFILLLCCMLMFVFPLSIIVTLPFVALPSTFAYITTHTMINIEKNCSILPFFSFYKAYFSKTFNGGFRGLLGLLKFILIEIIVSLIVGLLLYYLYCAKQPGFAEIMKNIESATTSENLSTAFDTLLDFKPFEYTVTITGQSALGIGSLVFINHIMLQSEIYVNAVRSKNIMPMKFLRPVFARMSNIRRKEFLKIYIPCTFFIYLVFIISIGGTFVLNDFFFGFSIYQSFAIGLAISILLNFFFIPYFVDVLGCFNAVSVDDFNKAIIDVAKMTVERARKKKLLTEEQLIQLELDLIKNAQQFIVPIVKEEDKQKEDKK